MKYEYSAMDIPEEDLYRVLNAYGAEEWRAVLIRYKDHNRYHLVFERTYRDY